MEPYYTDGRVTLFHGDCCEVLPQLHTPADLVVTDPPYVVGLASFGESTKASGWGDIMNAARFYAVWLREVRRLTNARQGAVWVFNSWRSFPVLARAMFEVEWSATSLLVWDKEWIGPGGVRGLRPSYEMVALFAHDEFALSNRGLPDVWRARRVPATPTGHPAEKPLPLLSRIVRESGCARPDAVILDPFSGSGSTLVAAKSCGARAVGIEVEEKWCEVTALRLQQEVLLP